jgi:hypothetical protein
VGNGNDPNVFGSVDINDRKPTAIAEHPSFGQVAAMSDIVRERGGSPETRIVKVGAGDPHAS